MNISWRITYSDFLFRKVTLARVIDCKLYLIPFSLKRIWDKLKEYELERRETKLETVVVVQCPVRGVLKWAC